MMFVKITDRSAKFILSVPFSIERVHVHAELSCSMNY